MFKVDLVICLFGYLLLNVYLFSIIAVTKEHPNGIPSLRGIIIFNQTVENNSLPQYRTESAS